MKRKKIIILEHGGGRLANQLWNFISIFAYAKEKNYEVYNYSFSDHYSDFSMTAPNFFIKIISNNYFRKNKIFIKLRLYRKYVNIIRRFYKSQIIDSGEMEQFYLPPSTNTNKTQSKLLESLEQSEVNKIYTKNWMFRNPAGIQKYRKEIIDYFKPSSEITGYLNKTFIELRSKYDHVIGVHVRQGDYRTFKNVNGDSLYIEQDRVREILDEYIYNYKLNNIKTIFVLCSDGLIDKSKFDEVNIFQMDKGPVNDLFALSRTDCVIGSDSTFGAFASYYGNIPFIIFDKNMIDWEYYKGKVCYFENKKSTVVFY